MAKISAEDRRVLRALFRWARDNDWQHSFLPCFLRNADGSEGVSWHRDEIWIASRDLWIRIRSVTEAVDVLAAFGVVPVSFSSAHDAGRKEGWSNACTAVREGLASTRWAPV